MFDSDKMRITHSYGPEEMNKCSGQESGSKHRLRKGKERKDLGSVGRAKPRILQWRQTSRPIAVETPAQPRCFERDALLKYNVASHALGCVGVPEDVKYTCMTKDELYPVRLTTPPTQTRDKNAATAPRWLPKQLLPEAPGTEGLTGGRGRRGGKAKRRSQERGTVVEGALGAGDVPSHSLDIEPLAVNPRLEETRTPWKSSCRPTTERFADASAPSAGPLAGALAGEARVAVGLRRPSSSALTESDSLPDFVLGPSAPLLMLPPVVDGVSPLAVPPPTQMQSAMLPLGLTQAPELYGALQMLSSLLILGVARSGLPIPALPESEGQSSGRLQCGLEKSVAETFLRAKCPAAT